MSLVHWKEKPVCVVYYESIKRELKIGGVYEEEGCLLLIDKVRGKDMTMSVGVMKDYKLKRRNLRASLYH